MQKPGRIDYAKLPGFASVSERISGSVDFQDETIGAKIGAKVGFEMQLPGDLPGDAAKVDRQEAPGDLVGLPRGRRSAD
jgi:hypothetical protein